MASNKRNVREALGEDGVRVVNRVPWVNSVVNGCNVDITIAYIHTFLGRLSYATFNDRRGGPSF